ncbi:unnamed protein product [Diamesa hyperborea]
MLNDEDMDDTHLCLRCNKTIIGLQNYVNHRQRECNVDNNTKPSPNKEIEQHFETGTFDFNNSTSGKKLNDYNFNFENDDREVEMDDDSFQHTNDDQHNKSVETEFKAYDYDFFSSLELQSSSKRETPHSHHNTKILTHRILTRKATAALMAQNGDEWIDDPSVDAMSEDDDTDESETDDVPRNIYNQPPQSFTGGKWKPGNAPPNKPSNWDLQENESSNDGQLDKSIDREECNSPPPPNHTRGKWIPGTKITKLEFKEDQISQKMAAERGNFWCGACSRNLASRKIYEKHLKSNLHRKRIKKQNEMEEAAEVLPQTNLNELSAHFKSLEQCEDEQQQQNNDVSDAEEKARMKKFRSRTIVTCFTCDMRLPSHLLGKHLISHYHYRKALQNPQKSFDIVLHNIHKIILQSPYQCHPCRYYFNTEHQFLRHWNSAQHLDTVTHINGNFFCSFCKFQCNDNGDMAQHLTDIEHQQVVSLIDRSKPIIIRKVTPCVCMNCDTHFRYNIELMHHLKVCNQTVTDNKQLFSCNECHKVFQSELRLQKHQIKVHHLSVFFCSECQMQFPTASDARIHRRTALHKTLSTRKKLLSLAANDQLTIKLKKVCPICKDERLDVLDLKNHIHESHPEHHYSCGMCGEKFVFPQEVSRHVRYKVCKFYNSTKTIQSPTTTVEEKIQFTCKMCLFSTNSHAEYLFHEILHQNLQHKSGEKLECPYCKKMFRKQSLRDHLRQHTNERIFVCPIDTCPMSFTRKANLKNHINSMHNSDITGDADSGPIKNVCQLCGKTFASKYILEQHKHVHRHQIESKRFPCQIQNCLYVARNTSDEQSHLLTHSDERLFYCEQSGCEYQGKTMEQLRSHSRKHQQIEPKYACAHCDYKTKLTSHLKRHEMIHKNERPFKCPYCEYSCNNSENLRKHVIGTSKHPGKFLYECNNCHRRNRFKSNFLKDYQLHLLQVHPE